MRRMRAQLSYANVMATIAVFGVLAGGGAYAAGVAKNSVKSKQIKDGGVKGLDLAPDAVTGDKIADGSLGKADLGPDALAGATGPQGPAGAAGKNGDDGDDGAPGADGTQLTPAQALDKVKQVDGPGSGLDADSVDGVDSNTMLRGYTFYKSISNPSGGGTGFGDLELFPGTRIHLNCNSNGGATSLIFIKPSGVAASLNVGATTDGVDVLFGESNDRIQLKNGAQRHGRFIPAGAGMEMYISDGEGTGASSSEFQAVYQQGSEAATVTGHLQMANVPGSNDYCEAIGTVVLGPVR